jgi:FkbM family methyltransferase
MKSRETFLWFGPAWVRMCARTLLRLNPLYRRGVRIVQMPVLSGLTRDLGPVRTRLRRGPRLWIDPNECSGRAIYYTGDYDSKITWICQRLLRPGDCFLDVGACLGEVGLYAAQFVGPSGRVEIFEPQPKLAKLIRASADLNRFAHVHVHEIALSDQEGTLDFFVPLGHRGGGSLVAQAVAGCETKVIAVAVRRADSFLRGLDLPRIRLLKLDVEDHEEQFMAGAMEYLRENKPATIVFESHHSGQPFFDRGTVKLIRSLGYDFLQIRQKTVLCVHLKRLESNDALENGSDFIALSTAPQDRDVYSLLQVR